MGKKLQFTHDNSLMMSIEMFFKVILGCFLIRINEFCKEVLQGTFSHSATTSLHTIKNVYSHTTTITGQVS
ncbi:hypothetical protein [Belliella aquatica]|uniref:hypothetical protein n=1 Tax=Belliella aquatica TaxID=1323734 RepID=UPI001667AA2F|nr:hypothetical protein [Belliella aquatica]MCH7407204.1 hypothetical protein [Belliella aquatica]